MITELLSEVTDADMNVVEDTSSPEWTPSDADIAALFHSDDEQQVSDVKPEVDDAAVEASPEEQSQAQPPKEQPKQEERNAPPKRIAQLLEQRKAAEQKALEHEQEALTMRTAFELLQAEYQKAQERLRELDYVDPRDARLQEIERERLYETKQRELEASFAERQRVAMVQAKAEVLAQQIADEAFAALDKYPALSREELAYLIQNKPGVSPMQLAAEHDSKKRAVYEREFATKYKAIAPQPTKPNGAKQQAVRSGGDEVDDMVASLRAELGAEWFSK